MRALSSFAAAVIAASISGCGGFDNDDLRRARVIGTVDGAVEGEARVMCRQLPESEDNLFDDDGPGFGPPDHDDDANEFAIEVPAGDSELFIVASKDRALLLPVSTRAGQVLRLGTLQMEPAAQLGVRVRVSGNLPANGTTVTLEATPYSKVALPLDGDRVVISPLPTGCFTVLAEVPGLPSKAQEACVVAGMLHEVELAFEN